MSKTITVPAPEPMFSIGDSVLHVSKDNTETRGIVYASNVFKVGQCHLLDINHIYMLDEERMLPCRIVLFEKYKAPHKKTIWNNMLPGYTREYAGSFDLLPPKQ